MQKNAILHGLDIYFCMITLDSVKKNQIYHIVGFNGDDNLLRRFLELGFTVGQKVKVVSSSLMRKVFLVEIRGYLLSVRRELLNRIVVE